VKKLCEFADTKIERGKRFIKEKEGKELEIEFPVRKEIIL
jgi:hypothetical protein